MTPMVTMARGSSARRPSVLSSPDHVAGGVAAAPVVLVVDDNADSLLGARVALEGHGYRVLIASGGRQAMALFEAEQPDCIVLDVRMKDLDGFAVCELVRALPHGADTPILFLTALRDIETFDRARRVGGDDFLTKPVSTKELLGRVQAALKVRTMSGELREHFGLLRDQRDSMQRLLLERERLMAFVVHDLKNPVNSMDLHAQVLLRDGSMAPDLRDSAAHIRTAARHLSRMIMNLLDLSKGDEGKLLPLFSSIDISALAFDVAAELAVHAQERAVELEVDVHVTRSVRVDEQLLRRCLTNLVENAIHHSPAGSAVRLVATSVLRGTLIRVIDKGDGIAVDMREAVFEPFVQLERASGSAPARSGRGLGLAFCKMAVEVQGGQIWVEDGEPGAVFCVLLRDVS